MPIRTDMIHTCRQRDNDVVILELLKLFFFADGCFWCLKTHQKQLHHWVRVLSPFGSNETHILLRVEHIKVILLLVPFLPHSEGDWGFEQHYHLMIWRFSWLSCIVKREKNTLRKSEKNTKRNLETLMTVFINFRISQ